MRWWWILLAACGGSTDAVDAPPTRVPGFTAQYFDRYRTSTKARVEPAIDHVWAGAPIDGVGADHFSARYTAMLSATAAGTYTFVTNSDDGVRLWVNGTLVIDDWRGHFPERHEGQIELPRGSVELRLEYFERDLGAELHLAWAPPGEAEALLDAAHVTTAPMIDGAPKPPYLNPVVAEDCPDPGVLATSDAYYVVCTGGSFPIRRSFDLVQWEDTGASVFADGKPPYAANGARNWAPEIHAVGTKYVVYYTSVNASDVLSIGAASADLPTGPFADLGAPLVEDPEGVIDATYVAANGTHYLAFKIDGNSVGDPTPIYIQELAPDGLSFASGSSPVEILRNSPATWEGGVVEAPWIVEHDGMFYLFYSGNVYDQRYRTGVARSASITGPYTKNQANPILRNTPMWVGPGHGSVVHDGAKDYFVYHAWRNNGAGGNNASAGRQILVDAIAWGADGWPTIDGPSATEKPWPGD